MQEGGGGQVGREIDWIVALHLKGQVTLDVRFLTQILVFTSRSDSNNRWDLLNEARKNLSHRFWSRFAPVFGTFVKIPHSRCRMFVWISEQSFAYDYCRLWSLQTNMAFTRLLWLILFVAPSTTLAQCPQNCRCSSQGSPGSPSYKKIVDCSGKLGNLEVAPDIPTDVTHL